MNGYQLGKGVLVQVIDNGSGIAPVLRDRVGTPFVTTKPTGEGTGLGLFLTRRVVEQAFGGRLLIESEPGRGATVSVELPGAEEPPTCASES